MTDIKKEMTDKLYGASSSMEEQILAQLTIERICEDMADFYAEFYGRLGPGVIVYAPTAEKEEDSMFYLTADQLIGAQEDLRKNGDDGTVEVLRKALVKAETIDSSKEALFIINDDSKIALLYYNREKPLTGPVKA
jgi:hypothetical protein